MKWLRRGLWIVIIVGGLVALGMAWGGPGLLDSWARLALDRLPAWARLWNSASTDYDERDDDGTEKASEAEGGRESFWLGFGEPKTVQLGAVKAVLWAAGKRPGLYSMKDVLGFNLSSQSSSPTGV